MGVISVTTGTNLFWLGRYVERAYTTMKTLLSYYDSMLDSNKDIYKQYLKSFGLFDTYSNMYEFIDSFLFEDENPNSVHHSLIKAYDNGIVLRDAISTETLSLLQMSIDRLESAKLSQKPKRLSMLKLQDYLYAFWGCLDNNMYEKEEKNIVLCGKMIERLDLYLRLGYPKDEIQKNFRILCDRLADVPRNTPYRYNTAQLSNLVEIIETNDTEYFENNRFSAVSSLYRLFEEN